MPHPAVLPFLFAACTSGGPARLPVDSAASDTAPGGGESADPNDSAASEDVPGATDGDPGCPSLYQPHLLPSFALVLSAGDWTALQADYYEGEKEYHPARFTYTAPSGEVIEVDDAAVRLRGNPGFSWLGEKMQFAVSFNEYDPAGRFLGLRKLSLDSSWYDPTLLRDRLAYRIFRDAGVPGSCTNNAMLTINGEYYGLYKNVEFVDQEYLERNFGDAAADGGLWKYGTTLTANEENADTLLLQAFWRNPTVSWMEEHTDLDANLREWAAEILLPHNDGYWCCNHNFYLYEHPDRGLLFLPWDLDYSFDAAPYFADPATWYRDSNSQPHLDAVAADPTWGPRFLEVLDEVTNTLDPAVTATWIQDWSVQIADAFAADPHTNFSAAEHDSAVERLAAYVAGRKGFVHAWVRASQGSTEDLDGDGADVTTDCDDGDPTIHPGAAETCNLRDDDCDGWIDTGAGCDTCEEHAFGEARFLLCWEPRTWDEAQAVCAAHGADLDFGRTTEEIYVVFIHTYWHTAYFKGIYDWWVGATDTAREGTWVDLAGDDVSAWAAWASGQPGGGRRENCATFSPTVWTWDDRACDELLPAVCRIR